MTNPTELAPVIQADRDAAWPFRPACYKDDPTTRQRWRDGAYDTAAPCIQAFARHRISHTPAPVEGVVTAVDAFEMGYAWARELKGQTLEDSRAVGRTLYQDTFEPISEQIDKIVQEDGFDSFASADKGIVAAKAIIKSALATAALKSSGLDEAIKALEPFASAATEISDERHDAEFIEDDDGLCLQVGHYRRARTTLANLRGQQS